MTLPSGGPFKYSFKTVDCKIETLRLKCQAVKMIMTNLHQSPGTDVAKCVYAKVNIVVMSAYKIATTYLII